MYQPKKKYECVRFFFNLKLFKFHIYYDVEEKCTIFFFVKVSELHLR